MEAWVSLVNIRAQQFDELDKTFPKEEGMSPKYPLYACWDRQTPPEIWPPGQALNLRIEGRQVFYRIDPPEQDLPLEERGFGV